MFEECFSTLEMDAVPLLAGSGDDDGVPEPDFDNLSTMLVSLLDEVLSDFEDTLPNFH